MAKAEIKKDVQIILGLSLEEADFLKCLVQNDLMGGETEDQREMRKSIFIELQNAFEQENLNHGNIL